MQNQSSIKQAAALKMELQRAAELTKRKVIHLYLSIWVYIGLGNKKPD